MVHRQPPGNGNLAIPLFLEKSIIQDRFMSQMILFTINRAIFVNFVVKIQKPILTKK